MVVRNPDILSEVQPSLETLIEMYLLTDPATTTLERPQRAQMAREAIALWWQIYDKLVFWAQCELLGRELMDEHAGLVGMWVERNKISDDTLSYLAELIGYSCSRGEEFDDADRAYLLDILGHRQMEIVDILPTLGLHARGRAFLEELLSHDNGNLFLREMMHRVVGKFRRARQNAAAHNGQDLEEVLSQPSAFQWKLEALRQVRLMVGQGYKKITALVEVAAAVNHSVDELQNWERELVRFGDLENDLYCAELVGEFEQYFRTTHYSNIPNYDRYGSFDGVHNMERAAKLARVVRRVSLHEINKALRNVR